MQNQSEISDRKYQELKVFLSSKKLPRHTVEIKVKGDLKTLYLPNYETILVVLNRKAFMSGEIRVILQNQSRSPSPVLIISPNGEVRQRPYSGGQTPEDILTIKDFHYFRYDLYSAILVAVKKVETLLEPALNREVNNEIRLIK